MLIELLTLQFHGVAREAIHFPAGKPANALRGAFGAALRRVAGEEAYTRIFAPSRAGGPSGFADAPRPFVLRARHLGGQSIAPGEDFCFDVNLFDPAMADCFIDVMSGVIALKRVEREQRRLNLDPAPGSIPGASVEFLTPTELKSGRGIAERPDFPILFARIRDRLSTLSSLYGSGPLPIDFRALGERAAQVRLSACDIRRVEVSRRSANTGQTHPLGGFIGTAEYRGEMAEFLPYLEAARWTGVGRQTVWGKGELSVCGAG